MTKTPPGQKKHKRDIRRERLAHLAQIRPKAAAANTKRAKTALGSGESPIGQFSGDNLTPITPTKVFDIKEVVSFVLSGAHGVLACPHVIVGASQMYAMLQGRVSIWSTHAIFKNKGMNKGDWAEHAFRNSGAAIIAEHPRGRSPRFPFLGAVGDFVINEGGKSICVEVKSKTSLTEAQNVLSDKKSLLQLWTTMEILGYKYGRLVAYHVSQPDGRPKELVFVGSVDVTLKVSLLTERSYSIIDAYVYFLKAYYLAFTGRSIDSTTRYEIANMIHAHFRETSNRETYMLPSLKAGDHCRRLSEALFEKKTTNSRPAQRPLKNQSIGLNSGMHSEDIRIATISLRTSAPKLFEFNYMSLDKPNSRRTSWNFSARSLRTTPSQEVAIKHHRRLQKEKDKGGYFDLTLPVSALSEPRKLRLDLDKDTLNRLTTMYVPVHK